MDIRNWTLFSLLDKEFAATIDMACVYGNLGNEAILVTKNDEVFSMGSNSSGCLGLGDLRSTLNPKRVDSLCHKRVKGFSYGTGPHVVAYTENGDLYSWGNNGYCELGNGTSNPCLVPTQIIPSVSKEVVDVACGSHHTLALTRDGEVRRATARSDIVICNLLWAVYAWGQNNCGQVGSGMSTNQSAPRKVNSCIGGKKVVSIACGQTSSMAVVDSGEVYGWGYNGNGQLGLGNTVNQLNPSRVTNLHGVVVTKIVCGYAHSMAVSDVGCLYVWGANSYGQLGTGNKTNISVPVQVGADIGRVVDIAATHYNHISAAITQSSKVYMWGQCRGQSVSTPFLTPFSRLHDVFACFATPSVMWRPMRVELDVWEKLSDALRNAFDDQSSSDLTVTVQGKPIHVHKSLLKIRCQHFRSMFQDHWQEDTLSVLEMNQYSYNVYRAFLEYLYTDQVSLPPESALELLDLANAYCESHLKRRCEQIIKHGITVENAAMLYSTALLYQAKVSATLALVMTTITLAQGFCYSR
uniref:BTB domain-containing protein n=1 Tax=Timema tahoe TaxID=61484 RepID=A0A7R9NXJ8_9NEOP|nr:unnamed protein product [Timema tahoe]